MRVFLLLITLTGLLLAGEIAGRPTLDADAVRAGMARGRLLIENSTGGRQVAVLIARTAAQRAVGYQHLPRQAARPMWFVFPRAGISHWHMRNVAYPLDIAFVAEGGRVIDIQRMQPEASGYHPPAPVRAALEVPAGDLSRLAIDVGSRLRLIHQGSERQ